ncbi:autophagy-related protein 3 [Echria macrotheca]|uniref:Autophagy-related protein 3 n=1 Tax=Echria macrotheca TaxID=438768 RepID=A0AAJ0F724_9PEZI|nr:autophagy-related protein 3 [Echria macrotheca]
MAAIADVSVAQLDPVKNFCRRFGHQTAVIDRKLYIDGGFVNYNPLSQYPTNYTNTGLLYHDLDVLGSAGMPQLYANLTKNSSIPSVNGGALWADDVNKRFYLFGGEYNGQPPPPYITLWSYDVLNNDWYSFGTPTQAGINGVSYGAGVGVSERGEGYYYGGWMSNNTVSDWNGSPVATSAMVKYDMDSNSWSNNTGPDGVRRAEGSMVFIPIGDGGMLVYFGGIQDRYGNGTVEGQPMEQIFLYDVLSSKWYTQNATGDVPEMRARFCAGATWAADQSSYNIYLYGGAGMPPDTAGFDDVYILTIPSFQWIKLYPDGDKTGQYPHHSLSCNVISGAQMLIIGGTFPLGSQCDVPDQFGSHNLDLGEQNPDHAPWKLFLPSLTHPAVPPLIASAVGGSADGGATKTAPSAGFSNPDLKVLMTRKANIPTRTPTRSIPDPSESAKSGAAALPGGAIAGIAVGGAVAVFCVVGLLTWFIRRRRHRAREASSHGVTKCMSNVPPGATPWSPGSAVTAVASYTPSSPHPTSPFLPRPVELEAARGERSWGSDGVLYELVTPGMEGTGMGTGSGEEVVETKMVDSEGRVWMRVPMAGQGLGLGMGHGTGIGSPVGGVGGEQQQQVLSTTPQSSVGGLGVSPVAGREPHELPGGVVEGTGFGSRVDGLSRHDTYYHP